MKMRRASRLFLVASLFAASGCNQLGVCELPAERVCDYSTDKGECSAKGGKWISAGEESGLSPADKQQAACIHAGYLDCHPGALQCRR